MFESKIPSSAVVKSTAAAILVGKRVSATISALIPIFACFAFYILISGFSILFKGSLTFLVPVALIIVFILFVHPIILGTIRYFWRLSDGADDQPTEVFYYFGSSFCYKRALKSILLMIFKCFTALFTCLLPYLIVSVLSNGWIYQFLGTEVPLWVAGLALVQSFLRIVGIFATLAVISRFYLFYAIVVMDEDMLLLEAIHISIMVSRRSVSAFLCMTVSFFGWILLSFFAVPLIYTAPLFFCCYVVHSRYALVNYNLNLELYSKDNYNTAY